MTLSQVSQTGSKTSLTLHRRKTIVDTKTAFETLLLRTGFIEPISIAVDKSTHAVALCRIKDLTAWMGFVKSFLSAVSNESTAIISKQYLLKDGELVFCWRIEVSSKSRKTMLHLLVNTLVYTAVAISESIPKVAQKPATPAKKPTGLRVVSRQVDAKGVLLREEVEMPIPHVRGDFNKTTPPVFSETLGRYVGGGRGASLINNDKRRGS